MSKEYRKVDVGFLVDPKYSAIVVVATGADLVSFECKPSKCVVEETSDNFKYTITVPHIAEYLQGFTFPLGADKVSIYLNDKELEGRAFNVRTLTFIHPVPIQRNAIISVSYRLNSYLFSDRKVKMLPEKQHF